jgi:hypothetical protein
MLPKDLPEACFRTFWDELGCFRPADVPALFPENSACVSISQGEVDQALRFRRQYHERQQ